MNKQIKCVPLVRNAQLVAAIFVPVEPAAGPGA